MNSKDIHYRLATFQDDYDSVLALLRIHYYPEEPLTISCEPIEQDTHDEVENMSNLGHGTCVVAVSGKNIVGALLAGPKYPDEEEKLLKEASHIPNTKWGKFLIFLAALERNSNVYERYDVKRAIHGHVLAVDKNFRGMGIGLQLFENSMERARELGYPLYTTDCTSVFSSQLCERLKMDLVNVCAFADYRTADSDLQVFFPPGEHKLVKTYAKRLC